MLGKIYRSIVPKPIRKSLHSSKNTVVRNLYSFNWKVKNLSSFFHFCFFPKTIEDLCKFEQRHYSQNGEDGVIKAIFRKIGITNKFAVEFGIHSGEGNSIYLKKQGWNCLWMDGDGDGEIIKKEFITAENIEGLFQKYNVPLELDLLSIDIDSNDYWVWKAIKNYSPRLVILEYNASLGPLASKTIPYDTSFSWDRTNHFGASLAALNKISAAKNYTLVYCDSIGANAFFVRTDLVQNHFKISSLEATFKPPGYGHKINGVHQGHLPSDKKMLNV